MTRKRPRYVRTFHPGALLLLVLLVAFPSVASADIGLSAELRYTRRASAPAAEKPNVVTATRSHSPVGVGASAPGAAAAAAPERGTSRSTPSRRCDSPAPRAITQASAAHRTRCLAARLAWRDRAPTIALATLGIVGFHTAPAPPLD